MQPSIWRKNSQSIQKIPSQYPLHYPFAPYRFLPPLLFTQEQTSPQSQIKINLVVDTLPPAPKGPAVTSKEEKKQSERIEERKIFKLNPPKRKAGFEQEQTHRQHQVVNLKTAQEREVERQLAFTQKRNLQPNTLNHLFGFIQSAKKSGQITRRIFKRKAALDSKYSQKRFYLYQKELNRYKGNLSNLKSLHILSKPYDLPCERWDMQEQRFYLYVNRVLLRHFFEEYFLQVVATSSRIKSSTKSQHHSYRRRIRDMLREIILSELTL